MWNSTTLIYDRFTEESFNSRTLRTKETPYLDRSTVVSVNGNVRLCVAHDSFSLRFAVKWDTTYFWGEIIYLEMRRKVRDNLSLCAVSLPPEQYPSDSSRRSPMPKWWRVHQRMRIRANRERRSFGNIAQACVRKFLASVKMTRIRVSRCVQTRILRTPGSTWINVSQLVCNKRRNLFLAIIPRFNLEILLTTLLITRVTFFLM